MSKYNLVEPNERIKNKFKVVIKADSNDGDYITTTDIYTKESFEEIVDELINLKNNFSGRHELENYNNKFDLSIPYNGWDGYCHTLESIDITYIDKNNTMWQVELQ